MSEFKNCNIEMLEDRVIDALKNSNLKSINKIMKSINKSIIFTGAGGSVVVCKFAQKVFEHKNNCYTKILDPRDLYYAKINNFSNLLCVSYSGTNYGVDLSLNTNIKNKYLFTNNIQLNKNITNIYYSNILPKEKSFISLASTLIPISILLNYYLNNKVLNLIKNSFSESKKLINIFNNSLKNKNITIIYGSESSTAAYYLKNTFSEAGIANTLTFTKYNFCHGQSTLPFHMKNHDLIFFKNSKFNIENDLDKLILKKSKELYNNVLIIENNINDNILSDFDFVIKSIYLSYIVANNYNKDLSNVNYFPNIKELYNFNGTI